MSAKELPELRRDDSIAYIADRLLTSEDKTRQDVGIWFHSMGSVALLSRELVKQAQSLVDRTQAPVIINSHSGKMGVLPDLVSKDVGVVITRGAVTHQLAKVLADQKLKESGDALKKSLQENFTSEELKRMRDDLKAAMPQAVKEVTEKMADLVAQMKARGFKFPDPKPGLFQSKHGNYIGAAVATFACEIRGSEYCYAGVVTANWSTSMAGDKKVVVLMFEGAPTGNENYTVSEDFAQKILSMDDDTPFCLNFGSNIHDYCAISGHDMKRFVLAVVEATKLNRDYED